MMTILRGALCALRSLCGLGWGFGRGRTSRKHMRHAYPEMHDESSDEFLDADVQMWLPMYLWWDREVKRGRRVPDDHVAEGNIRRFAYVKTKIAALERSKRAYYMRLAVNRNISEADAFRSIEEWYSLKEQLLDEEHKRHQAVEYDIYCQICLERINDTILVPCQHEVCNDCFLRLPNSSECPFCRGVVEQVVLHENGAEGAETGVGAKRI